MRALLRKIRQILRDRKTRRIFTRLVSTVAAIVVFVTTYALVLPAITMESEAACGIEAHQHDQSCFTDDLVCEIPESSGHVHDDSCYQKVLTCGKEVHTHSAACYHVDTASQAATEAIAVASTESAAAAETENAMGDTDSLNAPVENNEPETGLDSSTENSVIEGSLDGSTDNSVPGGDLNPLTDEVSGSERGAWTSTEAAADATASTAASTGSTASTAASTEASVGATAGITATPESTAGETATTATSTGAADSTSSVAGYVPVLDELNFNTLLNKNTGIYYSWIADADSAVDKETDGADAAANTGEIPAPESTDTVTKTDEAQEEAAAENTGEPEVAATWNRIDKHTELKESDNLRLYLAYTIPAGSLNETNQTARYSLPGNIHLTDEQIDEINTTVNGIAGQYVGYDTLEILDQEMYGKYLGIEAVEGTRTPSDDLDEYLANNDGQEFISATVKVENVLDENTGLLKAQDLVFTFAPYTIQKNQHQYDSEGKPTKAGGEVNGWLAIDISTEQIDWEKADDGAQTADIIFVEKDKKSDIKEISTELRLVGIEADSDVNTKKVADADSTDSTNPAATDNKQDGTKDSEAADGELDKEAEKEQVNYPDVSFDDSITVTGGSLSTDTGAVSGDAGMAAETEITVHVEADKNTFPEGTTMILSAVPDEQMTTVAEAVEGAVDAPKTMGFHAVDISFRDVKGNEIEPLKPIRVSMTSDAIKRAVEDKSTAPVVVHVSDIVADVPAEERNTDNGDSKPAAVADEYTDDGDSEPAAAADEGADDGEAANVTDSDEVEGAADQYIAEPSETSADQAPDNSPDTPATPAATIIETDTVTKENNGDTLTFDAEAFSVYAIVYTVDFHYEVNDKMYDLSIPGGGFVSLEHLVEVLGIASADENTENGAETDENGTENGNKFKGEVPGANVSGDNGEGGANATADGEASPSADFMTYEEAIKLNEVEVSEATKKFVADVERVEFSNPELVWVGKIDEATTVGGIKESRGLQVEYSAELTEEQIAEINAQTVEAGDWALVSVQPFTSEETLTVTMKNDDVWTVKVTDEAVSEVQSGRSYVLYTVSNVNGHDIYRVLDIYGYSHDYTDPAQLETLGDEYLWTVSYSNNWIIRSKSTVRGGDGRDYYSYLDVNSGHNQQVNEVIKWVRAYSTDYPYVYLANNGNSTFNIYGINYNNLALCWNSGFLIHNSQYASAMRFYQQHPTYDYTVVTANASEGLVSGYSTQNGRQENNTDYIWSTTNTSKTNNTLITANPTSSRYLFSHWELDGDAVYANGTTTDDGSGATMGSRIETGQLKFSANNQELKACFILNPDVTSNVPAKSFDEEALQAWYNLLQNTNPPFTSVDKTAEVYDYYNRIYQIDFTAASGVQTFASDIDLSFVMDVSNSMLFPATMNPYKVDGNVVTKKLTSSSLNSLPHSNGEKYFVIGDEGYTSTVYTIWHNGSSWQFADASQYAINRYAERNGGSVHEKEYALNSSNLSTYTSNPPRLNTSDDFVIYTTSSDYFTGFNDIYSKNNPAYNRLYYMKNAMETIVADAKNLAEEAARLGDASDNSNVRVAWEVFNRLHSNGSDFKSVTDTTNGDANYNAIVNALDNTQTSGGTRQDRGLDWAIDNFSYASASTTSTKRIAILITDGAPMITGNDTHHNDYTSSHEQAMGDYYTPTTGDGAWLRDQIRSKANELKAGADGELGTDDDVTLITIGLGVDRVANAPEWLEEVAGELPSEQQVDGGSRKYFYNVTDTAKLKYVLYDILQTFSAGAIVDTTVTDVIDDAFYPVDKLGEPLRVGDTYTDDNGVTGTIGQKEVTLGNGTKKTLWTVTWDHESVKWADHGGWHGSVLVKTKEDFLGGNTINTNQESSVTANSFTADNSYDNFEPKVVPIENNKTVNPPTPYVNINELKMESDLTSWKVYLGENVDPAEELVRLCEQVRVVEMVTQTRDDDQDGEPDHRYNSGIMLGHQTEGEAEKFLLKDIIGELTPEDIAELLDGYTLIKEYDKDVAQAYGHDVGTIYIELSQCEVAAGETGLETSPHQTTVTNADNDGEPVELYELTVWYMADDPANIDYHTGNYIGEGAGRVTNDVIVECSHEINVFAKSLQLFKRNEDYSKALTDAKFAIYRTWRESDGIDKKVQLDDKPGDFFIEYPEVTVDENGIATFAKLLMLGENEQRFLVETEPPEGYILLTEPLEIILNFASSYRPVPPKDANGWTEDVVTDKPYDWEEKASLTVSDAQKANSEGQKDTSSIALDSQDGWSYYLIANNPGFVLPSTGGPGTRLIYFLGIMLTCLAGAGLVMRKRRRDAA